MVNNTKTKYIGVRFLSRSDIENFLDLLTKSNIQYRYDFQPNKIRTDKLTIRCIIIPYGEREIKHIRCMRLDGCYGFFTKEAEEYLTRNGNCCAGYDIIDYIKLNS